MHNTYTPTHSTYTHTYTHVSKDIAHTPNTLPTSTTPESWEACYWVWAAVSGEHKCIPWRPAGPRTAKGTRRVGRTVRARCIDHCAKLTVRAVKPLESILSTVKWRYLACIMTRITKTKNKRHTERISTLFQQEQTVRRVASDCRNRASEMA